MQRCPGPASGRARSDPSYRQQTPTCCGPCLFPEDGLTTSGSRRQPREGVCPTTWSGTGGSRKQTSTQTLPTCCGLFLYPEDGPTTSGCRRQPSEGVRPSTWLGTGGSRKQTSTQTLRHRRAPPLLLRGRRGVGTAAAASLAGPAPPEPPLPTPLSPLQARSAPMSPPQALGYVTVTAGTLVTFSRFHSPVTAGNKLLLLLLLHDSK